MKLTSTKNDFILYENLTNFLEQDSIPINGAWHYTKWNGCFGILTSQRLRFTHYSALEDTSEINYGFEQIRNYVLAHTKGMLNEFFKDLFFDFEKEVFSFLDFYTASFCLHPDNLTAWRLYGDDGKGCSIKFRREFFEAPPKIISNPADITFSRGIIYYDLNSIFPRLKKLIALVDAQIKKYKAFKNNKISIKNRLLIAKMFSASIMPLIALIKKNDHIVEQEQRIFALLTKENNYQKLSSTGLTYSSSLILTKKVEFEFSLEDVSEIMLGPQLKNPTLLLRIKNLLENLHRKGHKTEHISLTVSRQTYKDKQSNNVLLLP